jgi:hypothetical protein
MRYTLIILFTIQVFYGWAQPKSDQEIAIIKNQYSGAYLELQGMLNGSSPLNFKRAVFATENAYTNSKLDYENFNSQIRLYADLCMKISKQAKLIYDGSDYETVEKYASVFKLMTDSVQFLINDSSYFVTQPFKYDFEDFWGEKDWSKMFVTKLLSTNSGNCHSLPFLYKIICEELGVNAYLAMAPNHTYIKLRSKKVGWYNTELTSAYFPIDAWIMASGYIHLNAIQNGVYMDTLSQKQSIAVCVTDLAKGYERKFPDDLEFIEKCADLSIQYYPSYTNALILKAETMKKRFEKIMKNAGAANPSEAFSLPEAKIVFDDMEKLYFQIYKIGYRMMPKEMYMEWLTELKTEKEKYANKELINNLKTTR